jgi:hypothetical protein
MDTKTKKQRPWDFKKKRGSPSRGSLHEIPQRGAGSSDETSRGAGATSEPAVEVSAKGRVEPAVSNLPEVSLTTSLSGAGGSSTPLQGASGSNIPEEREGLRHLASGVSRIHLAKTNCLVVLGESSKRLRQAKQKPGAFSNRGREARLSRVKPRLGPLRGPGLREVPLQSGSILRKGPGTPEDQGLIERL